MRQSLTAPRSQRHTPTAFPSIRAPRAAKGTASGMTTLLATERTPVAVKRADRDRDRAQPHSRTTTRTHASTGAPSTEARTHTDTDARTHVTQDAYKQYRYGGAESGDVQYDQAQTHHAPCPVRASDLRDLKAGHAPWRSAYRALLTGGDQPRCAANDLETAGMMVQRIRDAQERGGWTSNERSRLSRMRRNWERRLAGQDPRYLVAGNRPGRLSRREQARVHCLRRIIDGQTGGLDGGPTARPVSVDTFTDLDQVRLG